MPTSRLGLPTAIGALSIAALAVLQWAAAHGQEPARFQGGVELIEVDASVVDRAGNPVLGLTPDDFEVLEDGQPQKIQTFSYVDIPLLARPAFAGVDRIVVNDARSNREPMSGRTYVIVLDDMNVGALFTTTVRTAAREFINAYIGAGDVAAIVYTSGRTDASVDFTTDHGLLLASADKFIGRGVRSVALEAADKYYEDRLTLSLDPPPGVPPENIPQLAADLQDSRSRTLGTSAKPTVDITDFDRAQRVVTVLNAVQAVASALTPIRSRRKAMVMFSEGMNYQLNEPFGLRSVSDVLRATQDTLNVAARANVTFYTIDPRGLVGAGADLMQMTGPGMPSGGTQIAILDELKRTQDSLRVLAEETGGFAALNANEFSSAFDRIVQSNSQYYVLGYAPPTHASDGTFHRIQVRVKRPDLQVVARRGYASPRPETADDRQRREAERRAREARRPDGDTTSGALRHVLGSPLEARGINLSVQAAPFRRSAKESSVALAIEIDGGRLPLSPPGRLELSFYDVNEAGKAGRGVRKDIDLGLKGDTLERVKSHGLRLNPRLTLASGRYQLRFGARESGAGDAGSLFYDLVVPDFSRDPLTISGLLVTSVSAQRTPTAEPDPIAAKQLPGAATARREFPVGDTLAIYAEAYPNVATAREMRVAVRLIAETGDEVFAARDSMAVKPGEPSNIFAQFALEDLAPGAYLLHVEAALESVDAPPAARETLLTVGARE